MLTVACVYKEEEGSPYTVDDVHRLAAAVHRNLKMEHRFLCLTDALHGEFERRIVNCFWDLPADGLRGWWAKMHLFEHPGPLLYFDLDTVIVGSLDPLAQAVIDSMGLIVLRNFYRPGIGSGILGWSAFTKLRGITERFTTQFYKVGQYVQRRNALSVRIAGRMYRGDQEWLGKYLTHGCPSTRPAHAFVQDLVPGIYSYKVDIRDKGLEEPPEDAAVVCFHGQPRPRAVESLPWMQEHWVKPEPFEQGIRTPEGALS